jgi:TRAP-type mannitol/chloroaromatic compound transport system permease small subunit
VDYLSRLASKIENAVVLTGRIAAWAGLFLVLITVFDVVTRNFSQSSSEFLRNLSSAQQVWFGSTLLQELEWHLHTILFLFCLGYAYIKGAHIRIDVFRDKFSVSTKAWIEIAGILLFLLPFCILVITFGIDFATSSYQQHEGSASGGGLPHRWVIKATLPAGLILLALSGVAVLLKQIAALAGTTQRREER